MTYACWAAVFEGATDRAYYEVLIPRLMEHLTLTHGIRNSTIPLNAAVIFERSENDLIANEACRNSDAYHLFFIHADTGGRNVAAGINQRSRAVCESMSLICAWPTERCITIAPRKETEAWILADPQAVTSALGYAGKPDDIGLPADALRAERLGDPKDTLSSAMKKVSGRKSVNNERIYPAIAQLQSWDALRRSKSFCRFEKDLRAALAHLGCVTPEP